MRIDEHMLADLPAWMEKRDDIPKGWLYIGDEKERYLLKERLYALEEKNLENFVKINQSCLANIRKTERFDTSVSGTLKIRFKNGDTDYEYRKEQN